MLLTAPPCSPWHTYKLPTRGHTRPLKKINDSSAYLHLHKFPPTILTAALVLAVYPVFAPGTGLVTQRPDVSRLTRARACHGVTRGAILTRAVPLTARAPLARLTNLKWKHLTTVI